MKLEQSNKGKFKRWISGSFNDEKITGEVRTFTAEEKAKLLKEARAYGKVNKYEIKDEGFDKEGRLIGPLYLNGKPQFNGKWVNFQFAQKLADKAGAELEVV